MKRFLALLLVALPLQVAAQSPAPRFAERSTDLGLRFEHRHFGTGEKYMYRTSRAMRPDSNILQQLTG